MAIRSAFARGDYEAVTKLKDTTETPTTKLLVGQAYSRIGADGLAADAVAKGIELLLGDKYWPKDAALDTLDPTSGMSVVEKRTLQEWLERIKEGEGKYDQLRLKRLRDLLSAGGRAQADRTVTPLDSDLEAIRQQIAVETEAEDAKARLYFGINLIGGTSAAGLAAITGVLGVATKATVAIAVLAFLSAAVSTVLTTMKPAEIENAARVKAAALEDLTAAINLFDTDRPSDKKKFLEAVQAAHERYAIAQGHAQIVPLIPS